MLRDLFIPHLYCEQGDPTGGVAAPPAPAAEPPVPVTESPWLGTHDKDGNPIGESAPAPDPYAQRPEPIEPPPPTQAQPQATPQQQAPQAPVISPEVEEGFTYYTGIRGALVEQDRQEKAILAQLNDLPADVAEEKRAYYEQRDRIRQQALAQIDVELANLKGSAIRDVANRALMPVVLDQLAEESRQKPGLQAIDKAHMVEFLRMYAPEQLRTAQAWYEQNANRFALQQRAHNGTDAMHGGGALGHGSTARLRGDALWAAAAKTYKMD